MVTTDLPSKLTALLVQEKHRLDRAFGRTLREARANLVLQGYSSTDNVFLHKQQYETDIEERLSTLSATLSRLLARASVREIHDNKPELERLAQTWLQVHIDDCQTRLNELAAKNGLVSLDQLDLGRDRLINSLAAELALLSATAPSVVARSEAFIDPVRIEELSSMPPSKFDVSRLVRLCQLAEVGRIGRGQA